MIWRHRGAQIPLEVYHGLPSGWRADDILKVHRSMRGTFPISDFEIGSWGAPSWLPDRYEWLRYKATLEQVADGVRAGDDACVEIAVRYIELRYIGSYSGFLRARLARSLKAACLNAHQTIRLNEHFLALVVNRDYTHEFRDYRKLWGRIITDEILDQVIAHFHARRSGRVEPPWLVGLMVAHKNLK